MKKRLKSWGFTFAHMQLIAIAVIVMGGLVYFDIGWKLWDSGNGESSVSDSASAGTQPFNLLEEFNKMMLEEVSPQPGNGEVLGNSVNSLPTPTPSPVPSEVVPTPTSKAVNVPEGFKGFR